MKRHQDKEILFSLVFIGLVAGACGYFFEKSPVAENLNTAAALLATEQNLATKDTLPAPVTLGFVGDIMLDRGVRKSVVNHFDGEYSKLFADASFLQQPDIMFANLEGPVSDTGKDQHHLYSFRMDPKSLTALRNAGIDVVSSANNHIFDYGTAAMADTMHRIRESGILTCGIGENSIRG